MSRKEMVNTFLILNTFLLAGVPEIITQEEFDDVKKAIFEMLKENKKLQQENEKNKHYKTLYQSLKRQKEELRDWLVEQEEKSWDEVSSTFGDVLDKLEELEDILKKKLEAE